MYKYTWQFLCASSFSSPMFLSNTCEMFSHEKNPSPKKPRNLLRGFRHFSSCCSVALPPAGMPEYAGSSVLNTLYSAAHPTRPLSIQGSPFSRTTFVCHISVSSSSVSLPASASSSNAGANAQRSGQSSIERRQSDTLFPCQLKSVQSVPS